MLSLESSFAEMDINHFLKKNGDQMAYFSVNISIKIVT